MNPNDKRGRVSYHYHGMMNLTLWEIQNYIMVGQPSPVDIIFIPYVQPSMVDKKQIQTYGIVIMTSGDACPTDMINFLGL